LKVVIAEDSVLISDLLAEVLSRIEGLEVAGIATNGIEAVSMVQNLRPDIVVLDISMPIKDGIEVLKEIRPINPATEIIMFTADSSEVMREFCLELGANYYVKKTNLRDLLDILRECVNKQSERDFSEFGCSPWPFQ
jgi:two-component system chemotaxis response regulator CheY